MHTRPPCRDRSSASAPAIWSRVSREKGSRNGTDLYNIPTRILKWASHKRPRVGGYNGTKLEKADGWSASVYPKYASPVLFSPCLLPPQQRENAKRIIVYIPSAWFKRIISLFLSLSYPGVDIIGSSRRMRTRLNVYNIEETKRCARRLERGRIYT